MINNERWTLVEKYEEKLILYSKDNIFITDILQKCIEKFKNV